MLKQTAMKFSIEQHEQIAFFSSIWLIFLITLDSPSPLTAIVIIGECENKSIFIEFNF
jgi:hypothetical protein